MKIVSWFSCGAASAVATKLVLAKAKQKENWDVSIVRIIVPEEHKDNERFAEQCQEWFGQEILTRKSDVYESCNDVWYRKRYMSGIAGAPCTTHMKRDVRKAFELEYQPDLQVFGYTFEEAKRADRFRMNNPEVGLVCPLIDNKLSKQDCHAIIDKAGIAMAEMYKLGFSNNNCIGCVKDQSPRSWNLVRKHFPEIFEERAKLSRQLNVKLVKLTKGEKKRIFLDELDPMDYSGKSVNTDCSILCQTTIDEFEENNDQN